MGAFKPGLSQKAGGVRARQLHSLRGRTLTANASPPTRQFSPWASRACMVNVAVRCTYAYSNASPKATQRFALLAPWAAKESGIRGVDSAGCLWGESAGGRCDGDGDGEYGAD